MAEDKAAADAKSAVEKLKADYGAEDLGTYMDARVDGKPIRVAEWNEGLKSYQPTAEGLELLKTPKPEKKADPKGKAPAAGPGSPSAPGVAPPPPAPPPGMGPTATPPPPPPPAPAKPNG